MISLPGPQKETITPKVLGSNSDFTEDFIGEIGGFSYTSYANCPFMLCVFQCILGPDTEFKYWLFHFPCNLGYVINT